MGQRRRRHDQSGAATLEYTGMTAAAVVLILAVLLAGATVAPGVGEKFRWALCKVTTLGQGSCGSPTSAAQHKPPKPCVVSADSQSSRTKIAVAVVTAADGRRFEVAKLSDGRYRVTLLKDGSVGLETGVGAGLTVTVDDTTVGASATAEAGAALDVTDGRVWYTADPDEVERMVSENGEDALESAVVGGGVPRWGWERVQDVGGWVSGNGDYDFPDADETYTEGGVSGDLSAEVTALTERADASAGVAQVLGKRETRDGKTTVYFKTKVKGGAGVQLLGNDVDGNLQLQGAQLSGSAELVTAATYDSDGTMTDVTVTAAAAGESRGLVSALFGGEADGALGNEKKGAVVYEASLPLRDDIDRQVANDFLLNAGIAQVGGVAVQGANLPNTVIATDRFLDAARRRGYTTKQSYDKKDKKLGLDASVELGLELGADVSVESSSQTSTGAQYWDGSKWVDRKECNPA